MWAVFIVAAGVGMVVWLLLAYGAEGDTRVLLDVIRTAGTLVVGAGGAAALLLAARRQRSTEIALQQKELDQRHQERVAAETRAHQERVAAATEHDAAARRVTELYTAAATQLGSDKAPVRLAGLYALERLAQDNPTQRQTVVNVLCAYLRMPHALPEDSSAVAADESADQNLVQLRTERAQEREVRLTAQRVLTAHLHPGDGAADTYWADIDLDLTGAVLVNFDVHDCRLGSARFNDARFVGDTRFDGAEFAGAAEFHGAEFAGAVMFDRVEFAGAATFAEAEIAGKSTFIAAKFAGDTRFVKTRFADAASFDDATFGSHVWLLEADFGGYAWFARVKFAGAVAFDSVRFAGFATFVDVEFADEVSFNNATFLGPAGFSRTKFAGSTSFGDEEEFSETSFSRGVSFEAAVFAQGVPSVVAALQGEPDPAEESVG